MRLALHLGRTPRELADSLDSDDLVELLAHCREHPLEDGWYQAGIIAAQVANSLRGRGGKTATPGQFHPGRAYRRRMTPGEMAAAMAPHTRRRLGRV